MPLNAAIPLSYNPTVALDMAGAKQNALVNQALMQKNMLADRQAQQDQAQQNFMNDAYGRAYDPASGQIDYNQMQALAAAGGRGGLIPGMLNQRAERDKATGEARKAQLELFNEGLKARQSLLNPNMSPEEYISWHEGNHTDPIVGPMLSQLGVKPGDSRAKIIERIKKGELPQLIAESAMGIQKLSERNTLTAEQQSMATDRAAGRTNAAGQLRVAERNAAINEGRLAFDMNRPPKGKNAPSPEGRSQVSSLTSSMRRYYDELSAAGGSVVPEGDVVSNIKARLSGTAAGQAAGSYIGTKAQSARTKIKQLRPLLVTAIKQATGMSAKQMDSNVELKLFLDAASNPDTADINANLEALNNIEKLYGLGEATAATPAAAAPAAAAPVGKTVTRTGSINGRKVVEYSDGSVVYAP